MASLKVLCQVRGVRTATRDQKGLEKNSKTGRTKDCLVVNIIDWTDWLKEQQSTLKLSLQ